MKLICAVTVAGLIDQTWGDARAKAAEQYRKVDNAAAYLAIRPIIGLSHEARIPPSQSIADEPPHQRGRTATAGWLSPPPSFWLSQCRPHL